jgi:hypothetical protein
VNPAADGAVSPARDGTASPARDGDAGLPHDGAANPMRDSADPHLADRQRTRARAAALHARGMPAPRAIGIAALEARIARWPAEWGDELWVLIHGDFAPPAHSLAFASLGVVIEPEPVKDSILRSAGCVLKARVAVPEKSVAAVIDAADRLAVLLGVYAAGVLGSTAAGWWSHLTHGAPGGAAPAFAVERIVPVLDALKGLPREIERRVRAAIYWIDEPRPVAAETYRFDILRRYAGYFCAFECLVDAINLMKPQPALSRAQKAEGIAAVVAVRGERLGPADIAELHRRYVAADFTARATHALKVCFGAAAPAHIEACFRANPERERLIAVNQAIRCGEIDAAALKERLRIENKQVRLAQIVFGMLARLVPAGHSGAPASRPVPPRTSDPVLPTGDAPSPPGA